ncbi:MAG: protein-glutamate O-methyltransferase CheR [Halobacteriota archaeon]|nr:protein-glutamate O-methyltransferase CheR [Halobacteriota archaeon]
MTEEDIAFDAIKRRIFEVRGLDTRQYKDSYIKRRLAVRMRANSAETYMDYLQILKKKTEEFNPLMDSLTINVTEFFRNPETYQAVEGIFRDIIVEKKNRGRNLLRIWSAGCSSGEEPYSIAILLSEILGDEISDFNITIYATDIDPIILNKAKAGVYKSENLKNVSEARIDKYFKSSGEDYIIRDEIKRMIRFQKLDLIADKKSKSFDMILCRNVVIYFSRELQERLYMDFYTSLNHNGYFVMGKTETLVGESMNRFKSVNKSERIYQKM